MDSNFLKLNNNKTEVIIFGQSELQDMYNLGPLASYNHSTVKSLGVLFDRTFNFEKKMSSVRGSFFQLRQIAKLKAYLSQKDLERIIHSFITSHLDYCNSLYVGLDKSSIKRLQLVQNAAARLLTRTKKRDHITPMVRLLHWLPVCHRIVFKILLLTFESFTDWHCLTDLNFS